MTAVYTLICVAALGLLVQAAFSIHLMLHSWSDPERRPRRSDSERSAPRLSFSLLLPAREEEAVIGDTLRQLARAHYPAEMVEVLVVCHASDTSTIAAAERAIAGFGPRRMRVVTYHGLRQSKPIALNAGLREASHDVLGVFDAEDDVHPELLDVVNDVMTRDRVSVVQAGVQLVNFWQHWFSIHNCLEYFFWFRSRLNYHAAVGAIPLGGNTVFVSTDLLRSVDGWDEQALTEDADLGMRISALGHTIRVIYEAQYATREETPHSLKQWTAQRTRWHQGFLQVLAKGDWRRLPRYQQRLLAAYTFLFPLLHAGLTLLWPLVLIGVFILESPLAVTMIAFLPLYMLVLQLPLTMVAAVVLVREYDARVSLRGLLAMPFTFLPYQMMLGVAALRGTYRQLRHEIGWEKTAHAGAHRERPTGVRFDAKMMLTETLRDLPAERGSLMTLDGATHTLRLEAAEGLVGATRRQVIGMDSLAGWVAQRKEPVRLDGALPPAEVRRLLRDGGLRSSVVLPLQANGELMVLAVSSRTAELDAGHVLEICKVARRHGAHPLGALSE